MKKILSISSFIAALWGGLAAVEADRYDICLPCLAWIVIWGIANSIKKPRAATRSKDKNLYLYDIKAPYRWQEGKTEVSA